jgi:tetratricopeptide (TPR) repeat protein
VHRARNTIFDKEADEDVLQRSQPRKLAGLDLAEAKLAAGDVATASSIAEKVLARQADTVQSAADAARAHFIMARVDLMTQKPDQAIDEFQKTLATSREQRLLAWSHIYLGRMLDLECKRDQALTEYKGALAVRDGQQDTRLAAERGVKAAYVARGHEHDCDESGDDLPGGASPSAGGQANAGAKAAGQNQAQGPPQ